MQFTQFYTTINDVFPIITWSLLGIFASLVIVSAVWAGIAFAIGGKQGVEGARKFIMRFFAAGLVAASSGAASAITQTALGTIKVTVPSGVPADILPFVQKTADISNSAIALLAVIFIVIVGVMMLVAALAFLSGEKMSEKGRTILMYLGGALLLIVLGVIVARYFANLAIQNRIKQTFQPPA
jgi:hypothetical protein